MKGYAAVHTIGCRLNQADSALISGRLREDGWEIVEPFHDNIDLLIINSCSVTGTAAQKSRQAARKFRKKFPQCRIVVTGCSAEMDRKSWENESAVDLIVSNPDKKKLIDRITGLISEFRYSIDEQPGAVFIEKATADFPFKSRAFIKVQEGCENFCTYCIVPYARGPERSRSWDEVINDFKNLVRGGFPEIVLTGVNICAYEDNGRRLPELVDELCAVPGDFRIRLSSTEPHPGNRELIEVMARNPKICRFLHLSLQHGANNILKAMNRHYTVAEYFDFVTAARSAIPDIHIGTDIIVGFPGETDELFDESCVNIEKLGFANIHIFSFSPRQGTPAAIMKNQVHAGIVKERYARLNQIAKTSNLKFRQNQLNKPLLVIFEKNEKGIFSGWSDNYIHVNSNSPGLELHEIIKIIPSELTADGVKTI